MDSYKLSNTGTPPGNNTTYGPLSGGNYTAAWNATEALEEQLISSAGTLKNLYVELAAAPSGVATIILTLRKNGADTALTVTITGAETSGSDTSNTVTVAAGDRVCWKAVVSLLGSGSTKPRISVDYAGDTAKESLMLSNFPSVAAGAYFPIDGETNFDASSAVEAKQLCATAGTIKKLYVRCGTAPGGAETRTFTVYLNGSATALSVVVTGAATTGNDTSNSFAVVAGDELSLRQIKSAGCANTNGSTWGTTFVATTDNEFPIWAGTSDDPSNSGTEYNGINTTNSTIFTGVAEADRLACGRASWITNFYVEVSTAPGSGKSFTFTLRNNVADTALSVAISGTATTGNDSEAAGVAIANFDNLSFQSVPASTPDLPVNVGWGFTATMVEPTSPFTPIMYFT